MKWSSPISIGFVFFVSVVALVRGELRLVCESEGRLKSIAGIEQSFPFWLEGGKKISVPEEAKWKVEGDLRENAQFVCWSPRYSLKKIELPDREKNFEERPFAGTIAIIHRAGDEPPEYVISINPTGTMMPESARLLLDDWSEGVSGRALAILAWVVDGQIVQTVAKPVPTTVGRDFFKVSHEFRLTDKEAAGQGIALLWMNGSFLPVKPRFAKSNAQSAYVAMLLGDDATLKAALQSGLKAKTTDRSMVALLNRAAEAGMLRSVETLLVAGAEIDGAGDNVPPLVLAAKNGRTAVVSRLLAANANSDPQGWGTLSLPFNVAVQDGFGDVALQLVQGKSESGAKISHSRFPLGRAIDQGMTEVARALLARGAAFNFKDPQMERLLITQAMLGHTGMVQLLLEQGVSAGAKDRDTSALIAGARSGDPAMARVLLAAGAAVDQTNGNKQTPLMIAALHDRTEYADVLFGKGADVAAHDDHGRTALHLAVAAGSEAMVKRLLAHGAKVDVRAENNVTPLGLALKAQAREMARALASQGAKLDRKDPDFEKQMEWAIALDLAPVIRAALAEGWPADAIFFSRWPAVLVAEIYGAHECGELLRTAGAKIVEGKNPRIVSPQELDERLRPVAIVAPIDPRDAYANYSASVVEVDAVLDAEGILQFARVTGGFNTRLSNATLNSIGGWKFSPPRQNGQPVSVRVRLPLAFPASRDRSAELSEIDVDPVPIKHPNPIFPKDALVKGYGGGVEWRLIVNTAGRAEHIQILSSSHPSLNEPAIKSLEQWTFKPGLRDGKPVNVRFQGRSFFSRS